MRVMSEVWPVQTAAGGRRRVPGRAPCPAKPNHRRLDWKTGSSPGTHQLYLMLTYQCTHSRSYTGTHTNIHTTHRSTRTRQHTPHTYAHNMHTTYAHSAHTHNIYSCVSQYHIHQATKTAERDTYYDHAPNLTKPPALLLSHRAAHLRRSAPRRLAAFHPSP